MKKICIAFLLLVGCSHRNSSDSDHLTSIQILDKNGLSETVSIKERLLVYENTNFMASQPYQKVVRVFGKVSAGKTFSKVTTYHPSGQLWQYLEIENGRAHGAYREWHANGELKISAQVIEGTPDVSELSQLSWLFDGVCSVFDEQGNTVAEIPYSKGFLEGPSLYYFSSGKLMKEVPYSKNEINGTVRIFNEEGETLESTPYREGAREGLSVTYWSIGQLKAEEFYKEGLLMRGIYHNLKGEVVAEIKDGFGKQALFEEKFLASLLEYREGKIEGEVQTFNAQGCLTNLYSLKDGMKTGEEWEYYPIEGSEKHPKLFLQWDQDTIQGVAKTWYETGVPESQREIKSNKKHGLSFAWFQEGDLMLMEEYEDDLLIKGSYYKKWEKSPISKVENGKGIATLFDKEGRLIRKIVYEKGLPQNDT